MTSSALVASSRTDRIAEVSRQTAETRIRVAINLDGTGQTRLNSGIGFLHHRAVHRCCAWHRHAGAAH